MAVSARLDDVGGRAGFKTDRDTPIVRTHTQPLKVAARPLQSPPPTHSKHLSPQRTQDALLRGSAPSRSRGCRHGACNPGLHVSSAGLIAAIRMYFST